jgi:hypothetical protein
MGVVCDSKVPGVSGHCDQGTGQCVCAADYFGAKCTVYHNPGGNQALLIVVGALVALMILVAGLAIAW